MALVKYNNNSISSVTALGSLSSGSLNLITTNTISSGVSSSSFTSSINSTYDTYMFKFINMHAANEYDPFQINFSVDGGSNYNVTKTTTFFRARHNEAGNTTGIPYETGQDIAQGTGYQNLTYNNGISNDESTSGTIFLFNPSNTTFVKHFISINSGLEGGGFYQNTYVAGYANTTSAINAVDFKMSSGNIDSGVIKMYGLSKS
tara:strand:+ start:223 stop:834 length:612 start_codon:yes stop_codon:yes gene_type:complete